MSILPRYLTVFFGISLCATFFISCSSPSSPQSPHYISSGNTLGFITWEQDQGRVSHGVMLEERREGKAPYHNTNTIDGEVNGGKLTLKIAGGLVTMTGEVSEDALTLHGVPMKNGVLETQTWQQGSQAQYNQLVTAFDAYIGVSVALETLRGHLEVVPPDSDPGTLRFASVAVQDRVSSLSVGVQNVQAAHSQYSRCSAYTLGVQPNLLGNEAFQAPDPERSTIAQDIALVEQLWRSVTRLPVPQIKGLSYSWQLSQDEVAKQLKPGQDLLASYKQVTEQEQTSLNESKRQYEQLVGSIDIHSLQSSCQP